MKRGWLSTELPDYRDHPSGATYSLFAYEELPPLPIHPDDQFEWLKREVEKEGSLGEGSFGDGSKPDLSNLSDIAATASIPLPDTFITFMQFPALHQRIRSCTDCYLDLADRAVKTVGTHDGYLIHFLSDSQWCCHWYIYIGKGGEHFVVTSWDAYGFNLDDDPHEDEDQTCWLNEIDLDMADIWLCAPAFNEFIFRFWLENEIWFALIDNASLTPMQKTYLSYYRK